MISLGKSSIRVESTAGDRKTDASIAGKDECDTP
jgi:hypothetical protein